MKSPRKNSALNRCVLETLESRQMFAAGGLDSSFGGGKLANPFGFDVQDSVALSDGRIILVGTLNTDFAVARLNPNGSPDTSFGGGDGLVTTDFGAKHADTAQQVAIQNDGNIVVAGIKRDAFLSKEGQWALARYNANGSLDATFGSGGKTTVLGFGLTGVISDLAIQSNGKIVFCGSRGTKGGIFSDDNFDFALVRLNASGSTDTSFGDSSGSARKGFVITGMGDQDFASSLVIQSNGRIVVGGTTGTLAGGKFALARYTSDGRLDSTFGKSGKVFRTLFGTSRLQAMALQGDGKIVAAGISDERMAIVRFNSDGTGELESPFGLLRNHAGGSVEQVDSVIIPQSGKILVVGRSEFKVSTGLKPQLLAVQLLDNGRLDATFGQQGVAKFEALTPHVFRASATLTQDGKVVVAAGRTILRFVQSVPRVDVISAPLAFETPGGDGIFQITRDGAYNFPTRVFFQVGGTATPGIDFTGLLFSEPSRTQGQFVRGGVPVNVGAILQPQVRSIVIPAGQSFVLIPVNIVTDTQFEGNESVIVTAQANAAYSLGKASATVTIQDDDQVHVNFQAPGTVPTGYVADTGLIFGARGAGLSYGWDVDNTVNTRIRNNTGSPDLRYDTLNHLQKPGGGSTWEIALPNGLYTVRIVAGDPSNIDSVYKLNLEGTLALSGTPSGDTRWFRSTVNVLVSDGRLTLSNASGAVNNKIAFIDIKGAAPGAVPGPVAANLPARLLSAATSTLWQRRPDGLFSDNQIDEPLWA